MKKVIIFAGLEEGKERYQLFINNTLISRKEDCYYQEESMDRASKAFAEVIAITFQTSPGTYPMNIRNGEKAELDESGEIQVWEIQKLEQDLIYSFAFSSVHFPSCTALCSKRVIFACAKLITRLYHSVSVICLLTSADNNSASASSRDSKVL